MVGGRAGAQEDPLLPIRLGRVSFLPSLSYSFGFEDNVERTNEEDPQLPPISSPIQDFRPTLRFEIPFEQSSMTLGYSARLREYGATELSGASGTNHYLDFTGRFQAAPSLRFDAEEHYIRGMAELQEVDPGGELRFSTQPFEVNNFMAGLALNLGAIQVVEAGAIFNTTSFFEGQVATSFLEGQAATTTFSSRSRDLFARYLISTGPDLQLYAVTDYQTVNQSRNTVQLEPSDYRTRSVGVGFRRKKEEGLTSDLRVSYAATDFLDAGGNPFTGITADGDLSRRIGVSGLLGVKLRRGPLTSFFNTNAFYLNEMLGITYSQKLGARFEMTVAGTVQQNAYPSPVLATQEVYAYLLPSNGMKRRDDVRSGSLKVLYHVGRPVELEVGYRQDSTRSNIIGEIDGVRYKIYDYDHSMFSAIVTFGWQ